MRARATLVAAAALLALPGCKDVGLENRNYPLDQAAHRPPDALVQAVHPETNPDHAARAAARAHSTMAQPISVGGQTFMAAGRAERIQSASLRAVGGGPGGAFSAAAWDEPPYDRLYLSHPGGMYVTYLPVHEDAREARMDGTEAH